MRWIIRHVPLVIALLYVTVVGVSAQESTPPADQMGPPESFEIAPGVVADNFLFAPGAMEPANYRLTFDEGVVYAVMPSTHLELGYVESGNLVITLDATTTVTRLGDVENGGTMVPANTEFTVEAGDYFVLQPGVGGEVRNEGTGPASIAVAGITPAGAQMPTGSPPATPAG